jgi:hypothetical protein
MAFAPSCTSNQRTRFIEAADLVVDGLEDFHHLSGGIVSIHMLMEQGNYRDALEVAESLLTLFDETKEVEGLNELRALIFLLQSVVKNAPPQEAE